ncbi:restriction endonuclease subunit S [Pisciglobus halotolerans]|uniref:Type I restriction enzyme, S subunit n=1 Tax=Pisciglobus halotolerans TaxID=745365 RepID=A0A1I3DUC3_9LACT|nr:restriction endonuclease subunit S [Pisciglobus halotolerans]SFH90340.1 type I restriction enzyme, S subunit [Pisciglobus halotolerans]
MSINKDKPNAPNLRFKGFTDDWEQRRLGDFVIKAVDNRGKTPPTQEFGRYPLLEVASLGRASPDYTKVTKYVDEETYNGWFRAHIKKDDILFSTVGNTGLVTLMDDYAGATIAQNIVAFRAIEGNNPQFLVQMFQLPENLKRAKRIEMGAVQPSIKVSQLIHVSYLLPNSEQEQEKIGNFLNFIENTITLHQRKLDQLNQLKEALLQQMFPGKGETVPKLRFAGFEGDWEERKLGQTDTYFTDGNYGEAYPSANDMSTKENGGVPFLRGSNFLNGYLDETNANYIKKEKHYELASGHIQEDDIILAVRGSLGTLGYATKQNVGWNINSQLAILRTNKSEIWGMFLTQYLLSRKGQKEMFSRITGTALKQLPIKQLKSIPVPIPNISEQKQVGLTFKQLDTMIALHQRKLEQLQNMKQVLLQNMFI